MRSKMLTGILALQDRHNRIREAGMGIVRHVAAGALGVLIGLTLFIMIAALTLIV